VVIYERELARPAPLSVGAEREELLGLVHDNISELITRIVADRSQQCLRWVLLVGNIIIEDNVIGPLTSEV
jgi:hypothetical protein